MYLLEEICSGLEIYYSGRSGGQYLKTAFILCDDYTELTAKLYLLSVDKGWSDRNKSGGFKSFHTVMDEATSAAATAGRDETRMRELTERMKARRKRRNDFFHSATLLDVNVSTRMCIESYCDLLELGRLLFGDAWDTAANSARAFGTLETLIRIERLALTDPTAWHAVTDVIQKWPRNHATAKTLGVHVARFPEDLHLRLCIIYGGTELQQRLLSIEAQHAGLGTT